MERIQSLPAMPKSEQPAEPEELNGLFRDDVALEKPVLYLVFKLCEALKEADVNYCHWKSNNALDRSASGDNDLDLLISRSDASRFAEILHRLGFKQAKAPADKQMKGVLDYYGYDEQADKWVHVHAHFQLIMGHDMTKNFRLALEEPYLESAVWNGIFKVPSVEFEFVVFVIRMVLKHSTWDAIIGREGQLKKSEQSELVYLQDLIDQQQVNAILEQHLPSIGKDLFNECVRALQPGYSILKRVRIGHVLQTRLRSNAYYPIWIDTGLKLLRRAVSILRWRIVKSPAKYNLQIGGALIAVVGGDGAGKSTAIESVHAWLSKKFDSTTIHMGRPAWSRLTVLIRFFLKIGQVVGLYPLETSFDETIQQRSLVSPGYPYLIREVSRARDRYWNYVRARLLAQDGSLVILDRFPLPQIKLMDGAQARQFVQALNAGPQAGRFLAPRPDSRFAQFLVRLEESYYDQIALPEILIALRVNPKIAVARKTNEDAAAVEKRSTEIWQLNWQETNAHLIDAGKSKEEVASEIKALIWSRL